MFYITVVGTLERYGWFILIGVIVLVYLWNKFKPQITRFIKKLEDQQQMKSYGMS